MLHVAHLSLAVIGDHLCGVIDSWRRERGIIGTSMPTIPVDWAAHRPQPISGRERSNWPVLVSDVKHQRGSPKV